MRKIFFWLHLTAGSIAGLVILIMSATGVLLTYEKQMIQWAEARSAEIEPGANRQPVSQLLQTTVGNTAASPASITIRRAAASPAEIALGPGKSVLVNPYTGAAAGEGAPNLRVFFRKVTLWHRWLGSQEGSRGWQKQVTGACNFAFVFLGFSGLYMWWPRRWTPAARRTAFVPQAGRSGKARDFNWHNALGFWASVPIIVIAGTATVMSYPWANNLVYQIAGEKPPAPRREGAPAEQRGGVGAPRGGEGRQARAFTTDGLDAIWQRAAATNRNWQTISMRFQGPRVSIHVDGGYGGQPQKRETLTFNRAGELLEREGFASLTPGRRARNYMRFLHTGEVWGLTGQTIAGLTSLIGVVLVWTGISLALRRLWAWNKRRNSPVRTAVEAEKTLTTA